MDSIKSWFFAGIMRCGNHAIINWLAHSVNGQIIHYNNVNVTKYKQFKKFNPDKPLTHKFISFENIAPQKCLDQNKTNIIILRDPYNWLASYLKHKDFFEGAINIYVKLYEYMQEHPETTFISFNEWFLSSSYRQDICDNLDVIMIADNMMNVSREGGGSSFDGLSFDGKAQNMGVLTRWKHYQHNTKYLAILKRHPKLTEISQQLFNFQPI